jgi:hypothetical protein
VCGWGGAGGGAGAVTAVGAGGPGSVPPQLSCRNTGPSYQVQACKAGAGGRLHRKPSRCVLPGAHLGAVVAARLVQTLQACVLLRPDVGVHLQVKLACGSKILYEVLLDNMECMGRQLSEQSQQWRGRRKLGGGLPGAAAVSGGAGRPLASPFCPPGMEGEQQQQNP